jgi:hypothetical protein
MAPVLPLSGDLTFQRNQPFNYSVSLAWRRDLEIEETFSGADSL